MNVWLMALLLGAVAIPIVVFASLGVAPTWVELVVWTIAGIGWVALAVAYTGRPWLAVLVAGPVSGLLAGGMQSLLLARLVANNAGWSEHAVDGATRLQAFWSAIPIGVVWGLVFAGIAWLATWLMDRDAPAMA